MRRHPPLFLLLAWIIGISPLYATEKTDWDFPLGPLGGRAYLQLGENSLRVSHLDTDGPGATAGLQANDYLFGAFGVPFDKSIKNFLNIYTGPLKGLGEAIEKARRGDGLLPLMVLRSGVGSLTVNLQLDPADRFGPAYPLGSASFAEAYERSCAAIHQGLLNETWRGVTGSTYPSYWSGLALLTHPDWNSTSGERPYRLSIDATRDRCLAALANAQYAPVEQYLLDRSANPNFVNQFAGHENWALNTALIFLSEYLQKTKDAQYYDEFQTAAEKIANRIQWWAQDDAGRHPPAGGAHAGVHSDYSGSGFNICVAHSFAALSMAKQVTDINGLPVLDLTVRPRDGRHYGYAEGVEKPSAAIAILPEGWDPALDPSIAEKMAWQWQQLKESAHPETGAVHYWHGLSSPTYARDGSARTAGATFAYRTSLGGQAVPAGEQSALDRMTDFSLRSHREHLYAHTHTISGVVFNHLSMAYWTSRQRRHFFENWKFFWNLAHQPEGAPEYFTALFENDNDCNYLLGELYTALPYGIARGGLDLVPGWDPDELIIDFQETPHCWDVPEYRTLSTATGSLDFQLALTDGLGRILSPASVTWTLTAGDPAHCLIANPDSLSTAVNFTRDGLYHLDLLVSAGERSTTESLRIHVHTRSAPEGYVMGSALYEYFADAGTGETIVSIFGTPSFARAAYQLDFPGFSESSAAKVSGAIVPSESGSYRFYLASRNDSHLSIDFDKDGSLDQIASSTHLPGDYDWTANPEQASVEIPLVADQIYPFQVIHKVGRHQPGPLAIAWTTPSNPEISIIESSVLARPFTQSTSMVNFDPKDIETTVGHFFSLNYGIASEETVIYQWYHDGIPVGDPNSSSRVFLWPVSSGGAGEYHCVATTGSQVFTSRTATVTLTDDGDLIEGGLWMDMFTETNGKELADLTDDVGFPWLIDGAMTLSSFDYKTPAGNANHLGHRVTGWIVPTETANYRFLVTGDDRVRLSLSPSEFSAHKQIIAETTGGSGRRVWTDIDAAKSEYLPLEAGKAYYLELLHKEDRGDSFFAVAWQKEGDPMPVKGEGEIPGEVLRYRKGGHFGEAGPTAAYLNDDSFSFLPNIPLTLNVLANDVDPSPLTITAFDQPTGGHLRLNHDGSALVYTDFEHGEAQTLSYTVQNEAGVTSSANILLTPMGGNDLAGHWTFDALQADQGVLDQSGNHHHLTANGLPELITDSVKGQALRFDNAWFNLPPSLHDSLGTPADEMTISFWLKADPGALPAYTTLLQARLDETAVLTISPPWNENIRYQVGNPGEGTQLLQFNQNAEDLNGNWVHYAFTHDTKKDRLAVYRNGVLTGENTSFTRNFASGFDLISLGANVNGSNRYPGAIDELRIFGKALKAREISTLHLAEARSPLTHWLDTYLDENTRTDPLLGGPFGDASGNGLANIFYYLFDLGDPANPSPPPLQSGDTPAAGLPTIKTEKNGALTFSYVHPRNQEDHTLTPAASADLITWKSLDDPTAVAQPDSTSIETIDSDYEIRHLHFDSPPFQFFLRMEVTPDTP